LSSNLKSDLSINSLINPSLLSEANTNSNEEKNKKGSNGMEPNRLKTDCDYCNDNKYINFSEKLVNEKNNEGNNPLNQVEHPSLRINNYRNENYINVSAYDEC